MPYTLILQIIAILGIILVSYAIFLETEKKQDIIFVIGFLCLFFYALYLENIIFMTAMGAFTTVSLIELIEIMIGVHKEEKKYNLKKIIRD